MKKNVKKKNERGIKIAVVVSKFNDFVTKRLFNACHQQLLNSGVLPKNITVIWVPGSLEIPVTALHLAAKKQIDAVICLGAVIRGETIHFELVSEGAAQGAAHVALTTGKPVIFGILTTDTVDQAYKRSLPKGGNKGRDAAVAALDMIQVLRQLKGKV